MASDGGAGRDDAAFPTVVRDLLAFLGTGQLVPPGDALRILRAGASAPSSAAEAIDAIVVAGAITASQGDMLRRNFVVAQRGRLEQMLAGAQTRGLVSAEDAGRIPVEFEAEALAHDPSGYLTAKGILTLVQAESLRTGRPYVDGVVSGLTSASAPVHAQQHVAAAVAPARTQEAIAPSAGDYVAALVGDLRRAGAALVALAAACAIIHGGLFAVQGGAAPSMWPVDEPWRTLFFSWITQAFCVSLFLVAALHSRKRLAPERLAMSTFAAAVAIGAPYRLLTEPSAATETVIVFGGLLALRWAVSLPMTSATIGASAALSIARVALTSATVTIVGSSDAALDAYETLYSNRPVSEIATELGLMVSVPATFFASLAPLVATAELWRSSPAPWSNLREIFLSRVALVPLAMGGGATCAVSYWLVHDGRFATPPVVTFGATCVIGVLLAVLGNKAPNSESTTS